MLNPKGTLGSLHKETLSAATVDNRFLVGRCPPSQAAITVVRSPRAAFVSRAVRVNPSVINHPKATEPIIFTPCSLALHVEPRRIVSSRSSRRGSTSRCRCRTYSASCVNHSRAASTRVRAKSPSKPLTSSLHSSHTSHLRFSSRDLAGPWCSFGFTKDQLVPTGSQIARIRERASSGAEVEIRAKASWQMTRSDSGEP
ncbi:hypothetical protein E5676_scaffold315G00010 [Cucumis melo var. makuwa]|uniref:Uncharacterized protein n=1 Tax=Cucumis melo var. makuwa TaxID=1194695 RepID=A0A5D3CHD3_CUCMM|nr:hypothetical protein E6C27_scaffold125G001230 [Cucumis melo var. makuwa]TYK10604.1 hypothetical protein E5676_scaffold315G00010 [Cucumis melo var. makuwa]